MKQYIFLLCIFLMNVSLFAMEEINSIPTTAKDQELAKLRTKISKLFNDQVINWLIKEEDNQDLIKSASMLKNDLCTYLKTYKLELTDADKSDLLSSIEYIESFIIADQKTTIEHSSRFSKRITEMVVTWLFKAVLK